MGIQFGMKREWPRTQPRSFVYLNGVFAVLHTKGRGNEGEILEDNRKHKEEGFNDLMASHASTQQCVLDKKLVVHKNRPLFRFLLNNHIFALMRKVAHENILQS